MVVKVCCTPGCSLGGREGAGGGGEGPLTHFKNIHQCLESAEGAHSLGTKHYKNCKRLEKKRKGEKERKKKDKKKRKKKERKKK